MYKKYNRLKNLKLKLFFKKEKRQKKKREKEEEEEEEENSTELQKPSVGAEVYNSNEKCN